MEIDIKNTQRTRWVFDDNILFFRKLRSFFPQLEPCDFEEIEDQMELDPEFTFEVPFIDDNISTEEPSAILVMEKDSAFIDFTVPFRMRRQLNIVEYLVHDTGKMVEQRTMTDEEWVERAQLLESMLLFDPTDLS